ncbi:D-lactate dehydrogenase [Komagataeibacter sp. FNDCR2]|uniref:D-lactate dehydrogenase n=1 Tax=Komagataeibacter sp. FNDCR2 TaxID=2878682 RepID=UPI00351CF228
MLNKAHGMSSPAGAELVTELRNIVGHPHVLTEDGATLPYRRGFRFGEGRALAVVMPGSLVEQWRVLRACVKAGVIVIMQAANTGLTGGSTPDGDTYDRDIVIVHSMRMRTIHLIGGGRQVVCLPGATLDQLEGRLKPIGREPHSVIGSSCIGASVFGGVSNNSGGALVRRGPAYTDMALFAQVSPAGELQLVNHLGIELGTDPEEILTRAEAGNFPESSIDWHAGRGHDDGYARHVRDVEADTPARYNADLRRLHEGSGCAGKLGLFAVRLDTFEAEKNPVVFYIGTNGTDVLEDVRRHILSSFAELPIAGEYLHRDAFNIAEKYGKDTFVIIRLIGTKRLPALFAMKNAFDRVAGRLGFLPKHFSDRCMQFLSHLFPEHLPARMRDYRDRFEHHLMLKVSASGAQEAREFLKSHFETHEGDFFECTPDEGAKAFLHRFAAAGAAIRYRDIHTDTTENIVALDVALRRNDRDWFEVLPRDIEDEIIVKLYYGHFLCHVMHQDYVVRKGYDCMALEHRMLPLLDRRGARYPAEHNFGHLYSAPDDVLAHYRQLDPCNCFNPGIGQATKRRNWVAESVG